MLLRSAAQTRRATYVMKPAVSTADHTDTACSRLLRSITRFHADAPSRDARITADMQRDQRAQWRPHRDLVPRQQQAASRRPSRRRSPIGLRSASYKTSPDTWCADPTDPKKGKALQYSTHQSTPAESSRRSRHGERLRGMLRADGQKDNGRTAGDRNANTRGCGVTTRGRWEGWWDRQPTSPTPQDRLSKTAASCTAHSHAGKGSKAGGRP